MKAKLIATVACVLLLIAALPAAATPVKILDVVVKVTAGSKTIGTFPVKGGRPIPTKVGVTYTLTLLGVTRSGGQSTTVPLDATFTIHAGKGRIALSNPTANGVDVKVLHSGPHGNQVKYVVTAGQNIDLRKGQAKGYINLF